MVFFSSKQFHQLHYNPQSSPGLLLGMCKAFYRLAIESRLACYRLGLVKTHRLPVPVVSIGNLTTGGTGKTPMVISLAQYLESQKLKVAILSRGYGGKNTIPWKVVTHPDDGDEPYLIQQTLQQGQVFVGRDRVLVGQKAIEIFQPDIILLDDGFQHLRLHRDLNIVLWDGEKGIGNGHLLPAGPLREPLREIRRADWVILTKHILPAQDVFLQNLLQPVGKTPSIPLARCPFIFQVYAASSQHPISCEALASKPLFLVSGIAHPETFDSMVTSSLGQEILSHLVFPDHTPYTPNEVSQIIGILEKHPDSVMLTTGKDWVKLAFVLPSHVTNRVYIAQVAPQIDWYPIVGPLLSHGVPSHV